MSRWQVKVAPVTKDLQLHAQTPRRRARQFGSISWEAVSSKELKSALTRELEVNRPGFRGGCLV